MVFASNTSTLPITSLAETSLKAENFIGLHFFSPVDKMPLVEVIMGEKTGQRALAVGMDFVRAIKKTPIVVNDCRGFYVNRCILNYMGEAHRMVMEGVPPAMIENCAKMAGMPVGPLALTDETGVDLAWKILKATEADLGEGSVDPAMKALFEAMVVKHQRFGRKNGKGFYDYPASGPKSLWPGLADIAGKQLDPDSISVKDLKDRFLFPTAAEAARCMFDGVVTDPREADVGSILGFAYAPYSGGTISFIEGMGLKAFVARARELAASYGPRIRPAREAGRDGREGRDLLRRLRQVAEGGVERMSRLGRPRDSRGRVRARRRRERLTRSASKRSCGRLVMRAAWTPFAATRGAGASSTRATVL